MSPLPRPIRLLRGATLADGARVDVQLDGGIVTRVEPAAADPAAGTRTDIAADTLDLDGFLLLTAPAEPHAHLDKARSWDLVQPPFGDLVRAIESWEAYSAEMTVDSIAERARAQALAMLRNGTTAIRSHVNLLSGPEPLRAVEALLRVRAELADVVDLQLVTLNPDTVSDEVIEQALDLGVELVGGAPHLAADPSAELGRMLAIAERRGLGIDLHTDESLEGTPTLLAYARAVRDWDRATQPVSAGHCVRLGTLDPEALDAVIAEVVASDVGVIALPITNLYLQGWQHPFAMPRGLTAVRALLDAGVRLGAGADNVRDPFNPVGRSDALETASLLVTAGHLDLEESYGAVSAGARSVMSLPPAGPVVGAAAELLAVRGRTLGEVIAEASPERLVIHRGSLVVRSTLQVELAGAVA